MASRTRRRRRRWVAAGRPAVRSRQHPPTRRVTMPPRGHGLGGRAGGGGGGGAECRCVRSWEMLVNLGAECVQITPDEGGTSSFASSLRPLDRTRRAGALQHGVGRFEITLDEGGTCSFASSLRPLEQTTFPLFSRERRPSRRWLLCRLCSASEVRRGLECES